MLIQRDIDIKTNMITKYATKLDEWNSKIPELIENGKNAIALRTDGTDFEGQPRPATTTVVEAAPPIIQEGEIVADEIPNSEIKKKDNLKDNDEDDDDGDDNDDDDVEFEEV